MAWENGIQVPFPLFFFAWLWKTDLNFVFRFSFSHHFEKRKRVSFWFRFSFSHHFEKTDLNFVFRFRITLKNGFEFRFSFSHHFEKRIWISFFVFVWLVIEKWIWISFVIFPWLEKRITAPVQSFEVPGHPLKVDRGIHFLCKWKQVNFSLPGAEVSDELLPPTRYSLF